MKLRLLMLALLFFVPSFGAQLVPIRSHAQTFVLVPKDIIFSEIIPRLAGNTGFNLAMTCKDSYSKLCNTQEDKICLLSCSVPMETNIYRRALVFYAQQSNNTKDISTQNNCKELIRTLVKYEGNANKHIRNKVLTAFNKNDSETDIIEIYGRDYSKKKYATLNTPIKSLTNNDLYILRLLFAQNFDPNTNHDNGNTLLHQAALVCNLKCIEYLVNYFKIDFNIQDNNGNTPLHCLTNHDNTAECTRSLIFSSNANIQNNNGDTPLHVFTEQDNIECIALLLNSVTDKSVTYDDFFWRTIKDLVDKTSIDPNLKNNAGYTPLRVAVECGNTKAMKLLLKHCAIDPNIKDNNGDTPLHRVIGLNNAEHLKLLLDHSKTNPNIKDHNKDTPLHCVIELNYTEHLKLLLNHSEMNPNIKNKAGDTPLHCALQNHNRKFLKLLLDDSRTNPNIKDKDGDTPFSCIMAYQHIAQKDEIKYIKLFLKNRRTKLTFMQKAYVYLLEKAGELS